MKQLTVAITDDGRVITQQVIFNAEVELYAENNNITIEEAEPIVFDIVNKIRFNRMLNFHMGDASDVLRLGEIMKANAISIEEYRRSKEVN